MLTVKSKASQNRNTKQSKCVNFTTVLTYIPIHSNQTLFLARTDKSTLEKHEVTVRASHVYIKARRKKVT